jgi:plasmid stabilization system protein ParE
MSGGFALHPEAARDITEIREYIAEDSPAAARDCRGTRPAQPAGDCDDFERPRVNEKLHGAA